ncbi:glycine--tRNA ligase subunit alpha [Candidatus Dojkabacteria bacterium]|nr:glycine--tRNA ligase subunit alpha [Candidatus Dojkabacteria bacterium]
MTKTFQEIVETLNNYWSKQGCNVVYPYGSEVGAATFNPHTVLGSVLFPEWNVCYIEPSHRPSDGRYGENPFRMQYYFQYQVILKPIPENNIDIYIKSLDTLGFDTAKHDIRLVEDNWESPSIGASGLGWEIWYDGMEVSQYTYFQQLGGKQLKSPALEITYGLERIAMYLQDKKHFRDIEWGKGVSYGDIFVSQEKDFSKYNFEVANISSLRKLFDLYESEAENALKSELYRVAYDYVLKMSHVFNILDARGAVGPSERYNTFSKMRTIVSKVIDKIAK